jgi:hypothetical protein
MAEDTSELATLRGGKDFFDWQGEKIAETKGGPGIVRLDTLEVGKVTQIGEYKAAFEGVVFIGSVYLPRKCWCAALSLTPSRWHLQKTRLGFSRSDRNSARLQQSTMARMAWSKGRRCPSPGNLRVWWKHGPEVRTIQWLNQRLSCGRSVHFARWKRRVV